MADRAKFLDFLDMIDGGGAGQRGNQFEGGGIFSMLANLMPINPYGSEDKVRREARDEFYGGLLGDSPDTVSAAEAAATPAITQRQRMSAAMANEARQRGLLQDALDPRGVSQMRPMAPVGSGIGSAPAPDFVTAMPMQGSGTSPAPAPDFVTAMPMPARDPNAELARFNQMMETIPMELRSTISQQMYRDYLLNGGTAAFPDYMKGM